MNTKALITDTCGTEFMRQGDLSCAICHTRLDFVQQSDISFLLEGIRRRDVRNDVQVLDMRNLLVKSSKLVEMRCKETECMDFGGNVSAQNGPVNNLVCSS